MLKWETRLADLRIDKDLTQQDVADAIGVQRRTYAWWELGKRDYSIENANKLANFHNESLDYVLGISNVKNNTERKTINLELLCSRLKEARNDLGNSQKELSKNTGFPLSTYACYEVGISKPTILKLCYIASYCKVSVDWLVGRTDKKEIK